ncbi:glycoside hydrolase family 9 protein [Tenacibaculum amylolyticum]|uniref:glycoside hydrolase family 9 protein n=1 Tax=Tenacibaculum amylolyticum TaxID=104269 RepID=UPI003895A928
MNAFLKYILLFFYLQITSRVVHSVENQFFLKELSEGGFAIRVNQVGYAINQPKLIAVVSNTSFSNLKYFISNNKGEVVEKGQTLESVLWKDANEYVAIVDVTNINIGGVYTITVDGVKKHFKVVYNPYKKLAEDVFKYYYFNRASTSITEKYGGKWKRGVGLLDRKVKIHASAATKKRPEGTIINATKGWFDAGDYNKYITNSGISTYTLLSAYENYTNYYNRQKFNIPESENELPDILDEVKWNLDWMLAMQDPNDGGVYHKLTGLQFSGVIMPNKYTFDRYVVQKSTSAALNFAGVTALAARIFSGIGGKQAYAKQLLIASEKAYSWAKKHPKDYFLNPKGVRTGQYEDSDLKGEFQWAAVELFITTKKETYKKAIKISEISNKIPWWQDTSALALYSILRHQKQLSGFINITEAKKIFLEKANELKDRIEKSPMQIAMNTSDYVWGSNGVAGNQLMYLMKAYEITKEDSFLKAVFIGVDYLLGRNGVGVSYITGQGEQSAQNPHHRTSEADNVKEPVPGMVVGGPQPGQQDKCKYISKMPAKSYSDTWCSYASNEVTINWNAPMVYVINALQYYQTK